jgi:hypothetical protein
VKITELTKLSFHLGLSSKYYFRKLPVPNTRSIDAFVGSQVFYRIKFSLNEGNCENKLCDVFKHSKDYHHLLSVEDLGTWDVDFMYGNYKSIHKLYEK